MSSRKPEGRASGSRGGEWGSGQSSVGRPQFGRHSSQNVREPDVPLSIRPLGGPEEMLDPNFEAHGRFLIDLTTFYIYPYGRHPVPVSYSLPEAGPAVNHGGVPLHTDSEFPSKGKESQVWR